MLSKVNCVKWLVAGGRGEEWTDCAVLSDCSNVTARSGEFGRGDLDVWFVACSRSFGWCDERYGQCCGECEDVHFCPRLLLHSIAVMDSQLCEMQFSVLVVVLAASYN